MKHKYSRVIAVLLALVLLIGTFSACKKAEEPAPEIEPSEVTTEVQKVTEAETEPVTEAEDTTLESYTAVAPTKANQDSIFRDKNGNSVISFGNGSSSSSTSTEAKNFRVVSYLVANSSLNNYSNIDKSHLKLQTDIIVFGIAGFNEDGTIWKDADFSKRLNNIKKAVKSSGSKAKIHINLLGPGSKSSSSVWEDQMEDQAIRHSNAFASGKLENNIANFVKNNGFDGVFFDYEYPLKKAYWIDFDEFLVRLDKKLGNKYIIGAAISPWNTKQTSEGIDVLDMVEVMSYDTWDNDGNHATFSQAKQDVIRMIILGYDISKLDLGIPFYGRPTTQEAYWYGYNGDVDRIDSNGLCKDKATGLTFSYNTPSVVYDKTNWAIKRGLHGVMIWHYACDTSASNKKSLFNAIEKAKKGKPLN